MPIRRAGGHVLTENGWVLAQDTEPEATVEETPDEVDVSEYHVGGGWYEIDGEKVHGKEAALAALAVDEDAKD